MALFPKYHGPPLLERVCSVENLTSAWRRVRSNIQVARRQRSAGTDAVSIRDFEADWSNQMSRLADELRAGTYRPLPPKRVNIPKASGGERAIAILAIRDRVAQRAVQQVLEPLFDPHFLDCSYGCRPRVGVPEAVERVARYAEQGLTWVVDADVSSYFDRVDQRILMGLLRQRLDDLPIMRLIVGWLEVGSLHTAETAALNPPHGSALLNRGGHVLRQLWDWQGQAPPMAPQPFPNDPYAVGSWDAPGANGDGLNGWSGSPQAPMLDPHNRLWTALMLAKPALEGAKRLWPHLQRIGGQRLMIAGAVAAGAVAASELILRWQQTEGRGTMQGGALSPLLANIYLHPFDLALSSQGLRLVRFMDDFVIMCASETEAQRALELARRQLDTLRLELKPEKTRVVNYAEGLEFLGQALAPPQRGPRLEDGLTSFDEARNRLRAAARRAKQKVTRKPDEGS